MRNIPALRADLSPHRLFWMGDPKAVAIFSVRVPRGEPGPWLGKGRWRPWRQRSSPTGRLDHWFLNQEPNLRRDGYASINRFTRYERAQKYVVRLGAAFVDIDCGRTAFDVSAEDALANLCELVELGGLPQPSMFQFSGRGLWPFWLLRDEKDPDITPYASPYHQVLWTSIQLRTADTIATVHPGLKLDRAASDLTRVTRIHGSLNSSAGRQVRYEVTLGPGDEPIRYTLEELAGFYGLRLPQNQSRLEAEDHRDLDLEAHRRRQDRNDAERREKQAARSGVNSSLSEWGRQGHIKLWRDRLDFLERVQVEVYGGAIPRGHRYQMLSAYAYCYAKLTQDLAQLAGLVASIGRKFCEQPAEDSLSDSELRGITEHALGWARSGGKITNRRLAAFAGLDPEADRERIERLGLNLTTGPKGQKELTRARREEAWKLLRAAHEGGENFPSARKLARRIFGRDRDWSV